MTDREFDPNNFEVLFGRSNVRGEFTINAMTLNNMDAQRDLGAQVQNSLKVATQW